MLSPAEIAEIKRENRELFESLIEKYVNCIKTLEEEGLYDLVRDEIDRINAQIARARQRIGKDDVDGFLDLRASVVDAHELLRHARALAKARGARTAQAEKVAQARAAAEQRLRAEQEALRLQERELAQIAAAEERDYRQREMQARQEKLRAEQQRQEQIAQVWQDEVNAWQDSEAFALASAALESLAHRMHADTSLSVAQLQQEITQLKTTYTEQAAELRVAEQERIQAQVEQEERLAAQRFAERTRALEMSKEQIATIDLEQLRELRQAAEQEYLARQTQEQQRRQIVAGLVHTLESKGFMVQSPELDTQRDFVIVRAQREQGQQVIARVARDGHMEKKFDGYEEMTCLKDLEELEALLEQAYGFNIEEKRLVWSADGKHRAQHQQQVARSTNTAVHRVAQSSSSSSSR